MTLGLVHASCNLPEWQAVKLTLHPGEALKIDFLSFAGKSSQATKNTVPEVGIYIHASRGTSKVTI